MFQILQLPDKPDAIAPDGSDVRLLLQLAGGSMAHFELASGHNSTAIVHWTVEEIWFFVGGVGEFWRRLGEDEAEVPVRSGTCISIPRGTHFQFRSFGPEPLSAIAITMPPWPGEGEALAVPGPWQPSPSA